MAFSVFYLGHGVGLRTTHFPRVLDGSAPRLKSSEPGSFSGPPRSARWASGFALDDVCTEAGRVEEEAEVAVPGHEHALGIAGYEAEPSRERKLRTLVHAARGMLIGLAASALLLFNGRVAGVSGARLFGWPPVAASATSPLVQAAGRPGALSRRTSTSMPCSFNEEKRVRMREMTVSLARGATRSS